MQIFLDKNEITRLWKIRSDTVKRYRSAKFLYQSFVALVLMSFFPWFTSGFDPGLRGKYMLSTIGLSAIILLIFSGLYFIKANAKLKKSKEMFEVILILMYDIVSLGWSSWIVIEMGSNHLVKLTNFSKSMQAGIDFTVGCLVFAVVLVSCLFSSPILQWHIRQREEFGKSQKLSIFTNKVIGIGVGVGLLLLNLPFRIHGIDLSVIVIYLLGTLAMSGLVFTAIIEIIEFSYYLRYRNILWVQSKDVAS